MLSSPLGRWEGNAGGSDNGADNLAGITKDIDEHGVRHEENPPDSSKAINNSGISHLRTRSDHHKRNQTGGQLFRPAVVCALKN